MNANDVYIISKRQKGNPRQILIDDGVRFYDGLDGSILILDQENEIGHSLHYTTSPYSKQHKIKCEAFKFSNIVTISSFMTMDDVEHLLDELINDEVINEDEKASIMENIELKTK